MVQCGDLLLMQVLLDFRVQLLNEGSENFLITGVHNIALSPEELVQVFLYIFRLLLHLIEVSPVFEVSTPQCIFPEPELLKLVPGVDQR